MTRQHNRPSTVGYALLQKFAENLYPELAGDILEQFEDVTRTRGKWAAHFKFWVEMSRFGTRAIVHRLLHRKRQKGVFLLPSFLKTGARSMVRNKGFTLISVFSLSLGIGVWLLLMLLVRDQQQYDAFHPNADRIVRVTSRNYNRSINRMVPLASTPGPMGPVLQAELPEVELATRLARMNAVARVDNERVQLNVAGAEPSFFDLFHFRLKEGNATSALKQPNSIVLSPRAALNLLGSVDPMGKTINLLTFGDFTVTGLLDIPGGKSHIQFDALVSLSSWEGASMVGTSAGNAIGDWTNTNNFWTYLLLSEAARGVDPSLLAQKVNAALAPHYAADRRQDFDFAIEPLREIALVQNDLGNQIAPVLGSRSLYVISIFALIIMLIAAVNYIGLSVSRSSRRSREVGVRKVIGATGSQIIRQFLSESVLVALGSLTLGALFLVWLIPLFNNLRFMQTAGVELAMTGLLDLQLLGYFAAVGLIVGLIAGIVPSIHLSRFTPAAVLSGVHRVKSQSRFSVRKLLIVSQFTLSILFVVITFTLYRQVDHLMSADYGFDSDRLISVELGGTSFETLEQSASGNSAINSIAASSDVPIAGGKAITYLQSDSLLTPLFAYFYSTSENFADVLGLNVLAGRYFSVDHPSDRQDAIVVNLVTARALGFQTAHRALGQYVRVGLNEAQQSSFQIVGVLEDFYFESDRDVVRRLVLFDDPTLWQYAIASPAINSELAAEALSSIWDRLNPEVEFVSSTFAGLLDRALDPVKDLRYIFSLAAGLAIFLSCLGLIGFATYTAENRRLEVGIRKIVGASSLKVVGLLAMEYAQMMLFGVLVAVPLIWITTTGLMKNFPVRAEFSLLWTAVAILVVVLLGLFSTIIQTWRTASLDPITVIRNE